MALRLRGPMFDRGVPLMAVAAVALYDLLHPNTRNETAVLTPAHDGSIIASIHDDATLLSTHIDLLPHEHYEHPLTNAILESLGSSYDGTNAIATTTLGYYFNSNPVPSPSEIPANATFASHHGLPVPAFSFASSSTLGTQIKVWSTLVVSGLAVLWQMMFGQGMLGWVSFAMFAFRWMPLRFSIPRLKRMLRLQPQTNIAQRQTPQLTCSNCLSAWRHLDNAMSNVQELMAELTKAKAAAASDRYISKFSLAGLRALVRRRNQTLDETRNHYEGELVKLRDETSTKLAAKAEEVTKLERSRDWIDDNSAKELKSAQDEIAINKCLLADSQKLAGNNKRLAEQRLKELTKLQSVLDETNSKHEKEITDLNACHDKEVEKLKTCHDKEVEKLNTCHKKEVEKLNQEIEHHVSSAKDLEAQGQEEVNRLNDRIEHNGGLLLDMHRIFDDFKAESEQTQIKQEQQITSLKYDLKKVTELRQHDHAEADKTVVDLETQLQSAQDKVAEQARMLASGKKKSIEIQSLTNSKIQSLQKELETAAEIHQSESTTSAGKIKELQDNLRNAEEELEEHRSNQLNDTSEDTIVGLQRQVIGLEKQLKSAEFDHKIDLEESNKTIQDLTLQLQEAKAEVEQQSLILNADQSVSCAAGTQTEVTTTDSQTQTDDAHVDPAILVAEEKIACLNQKLDASDEKLRLLREELSNRSEQKSACTQTEAQHTESVQTQTPSVSTDAQTQTSEVAVDADLNITQTTHNLEAELQATREKLTHAEAEAERLAKEPNTMQTIHNLEAELKAAREKLAHAEVEAERSAKERSERPKPDVQSISTQTEETVVETEMSDVDKYETSNAQPDETTIRLQAQLSTTQAELVELRNNFDHATQHASSLQEKMAHGEAQWNEVQARHESLKSEHGKLKHAYDESRSQVESLQKRFEEADTQTKQILHAGNQQLVYARRTATELKFQNDQLQKTHLEHEMTITSLKEETEHFETQKKNFEYNQKELVAKLHDAESNCAILRTHMDLAEQQIGELQGALIASGTRIKGLEDDVNVQLDRELDFLINDDSLLNNEQAFQAFADPAQDHPFNLVPQDGGNNAAPFSLDSAQATMWTGNGEGDLSSSLSTLKPSPGGSGEHWCSEQNMEAPAQTNDGGPEVDEYGMPRGYVPTEHVPPVDPFDNIDPALRGLPAEPSSPRKKLAPKGRLARKGGAAALQAAHAAVPLAQPFEALPYIGLPCDRSVTCTTGVLCKGQPCPSKKCGAHGKKPCLGTQPDGSPCRGSQCTGHTCGAKPCHGHMCIGHICGRAEGQEKDGD